MGLQIVDKEAEALVAELEAATGKDAGAILLDLLRREVEATRRRQPRYAATDLESRRRSMIGAAERYAARLPPNPKHPDEIIGYDKDGLPT